MASLLLLILSAVLSVRLSTAQPGSKPILLQPCAPPTSGNVSLDYTNSFRVLANYSLCTEVPIPPARMALRIYSVITSAVEDASLVFVARAQKNVLEWTLPYKPDSYTQSSPLVHQTLVPCVTKASYNASSVLSPYIDVFTESAVPLKYSLAVDLVQPFSLSLSVKNELQLSPLQAKLFFFEFPDNISIVTVDLTSQTYDCAFVSLQEGNVCPPSQTLYDSLSRGIYQTMTKSAFFTVSREGLRDPSFYIVLLKANDSLYCQSDKTNGTGMDIPKDVTIVVNEFKAFSGFTAAICTPVLGIFVTMILLTSAVYLSCFFLITKCNSGRYTKDQKNSVVKCLQHFSFKDSHLDEKYHCFCFPKRGEDALLDKKVHEVLSGASYSNTII